MENPRQKQEKAEKKESLEDLFHNLEKAFGKLPLPNGKRNILKFGNQELEREAEEDGKKVTKTYTLYKGGEKMLILKVQKNEDTGHYSISNSFDENGISFFSSNGFNPSKESNSAAINKFIQKIGKYQKNQSNEKVKRDLENSKRAKKIEKLSINQNNPEYILDQVS